MSYERLPPKHDPEYKWAVAWMGEYIGAVQGYLVNGMTPPTWSKWLEEKIKERLDVGQ
ncbi:unnamed protein product [marine sediment metagenome]|uniref:Uncharacterized protein n=1 Tax=marine sediment metagenome TaxID=412755 RepID=X0S221_9ZZZZ